MASHKRYPSIMGSEITIAACPGPAFAGLTTSSRKGVYNGRNSRIPWLSDRSPLI